MNPKPQLSRSIQTTYQYPLDKLHNKPLNRALLLPCPRTMLARQVVLLTFSKSIHRHKLLFCNSRDFLTHLESTLLQVLILKNFIPFRINTCEKSREGVRLWLTKYSFGVTLRNLAPRSKEHLFRQPQITSPPRLCRGHLLVESGLQPFKESPNV